jgi:hypothetical protein
MSSTRSSSTAVTASTSAPPPSMDSNSLRSAVRLLQALNALPSWVPSIGHIVVPKERKENRHDDYEEEEESMTNEDEVSAEDSTSQGSLTPEDQAVEFRTLLNSSACLKALNSVPSVVTAGTLSSIHHPPSNMMGTKHSSNDAVNGAVNIKVTDVKGTGKEDAYAHNAVIEDGMDQIKLHFDSANGSGNSVNSNVNGSSIHYEGSLLNIPDEIFTSLWQSAPISPFGHVASQETLIDPSVRHARELISPANLSVNSVLLTHLAQLWSKYMLPRRVRVEAYKLNIYGPGGHFAPHRDTPASGLVGTILIGLADTSDQNSGLRIWTNQHKHIDELNVSSSASASLKSGAAAATVIAASGGDNVDADVNADASIDVDVDVDEGEDENTDVNANVDESADADTDDISSSSMIWRSTAGSICMFYPDLTHAVLPITRG